MVEPSFADLTVDGEQYDAGVLGTNAEPAAPPVDDSPETPPAEPEPTPEAAQAAESESEPVRREDGTFAPKGKGKEPYQSKVGRLKSEAEQAKAEAAAKAAEVEAYRAELERLKRQPVERHEAPPEQFAFPEYGTWSEQPGNEGKSWEDYQDARTDARYAWNHQRTQFQAARQSRVDRYLTRADEFKRQTADYEAVMARNVTETQAGRLPLVSQELEREILESDAGPRLAYYLAQRPEEFRVINALRGSVLAKAIGKLEARVEAVDSGSASRASVVPPKPAPITPLGGGTAAAAESRPDPDEDSAVITVGSEWLRAENRKAREAGRLR